MWQQKNDQIESLQNQVNSLQNKLDELNTSNNTNTTNTNNTHDNTTNNTTDSDNTTKYSSELAQYVFQGNAKNFQCNRRYPISQMSCIGESETNDGKQKIYKYQAEIKSLADPPYEMWNSEIIVTEDEMIETNPLSSIAKNKIQLKLPLQEGNTWEQTIEYNNKQYVMKHEIIQMVRNDGINSICVKSTIDNFDGNGFKYIEAAIYTQGRGLVASDRDEGYGRGYFTFGLNSANSPSEYTGDKMMQDYVHYNFIGLDKAFEN